MRHEYRNELLAILSRRPGKGLPLGSIVRIVYNSHTSLFTSAPDFGKLYSSIGQYLRRQSLKKESPFVRCKKRGYYTVRRRPDYPKFI